jgi:hypothetical protein
MGVASGPLRATVFFLIDLIAYSGIEVLPSTRIGVTSTSSHSIGVWNVSPCQGDRAKAKVGVDESCAYYEKHVSVVPDKKKVYLISQTRLVKEKEYRT